MFEAGKRAGKVGVVDAQFRWVPAGMHMKALIDDGFIGQPLGFNVQLLMPLQQNGADVYPYCAYPEGGISPYLWLADATERRGRVAQFRFAHRPVPDAPARQGRERDGRDANGRAELAPARRHAA